MTSFLSNVSTWIRGKSPQITSLNSQPKPVAVVSDGSGTSNNVQEIIQLNSDVDSGVDSRGDHRDEPDSEVQFRTVGNKEGSSPSKQPGGFLQSSTPYVTRPEIKHNERAKTSVSYGHDDFPYTVLGQSQAYLKGRRNPKSITGGQTGMIISATLGPFLPGISGLSPKWGYS